MTDTERRAYIGELMNKFYIKMDSIMQSPNSLMQNDGVTLLHDVNNILAEFEKLESPQGVEQFRIQFELVKYRLQQAMFTTEQS